MSILSRSLYYVGKLLHKNRENFYHKDKIMFEDNHLYDIHYKYVTTLVQSSGFTPARPDCIGTGVVQWLFAEPLTVKRGFFMSRLRTLGMDNGAWLQVEPPSTGGTM